MSEDVIESNETRLVVRDEPATLAKPVNVAQLLQELVSSGQAKDAAGAVKELVLLQEHQQDREAKRLFFEAFARVRAKCRTINPQKANPAKDGSVRWWMADLQQLLDEVEPILRSEQMELMFDAPRNAMNVNIIDGTCIIIHTPTGHSERWTCGFNVANAQGGDLGGATSAKRGALIAALALKVVHDDNSRVLGDVINTEQISELQRRVHGVGADVVKFLAFALDCRPETIQPDNRDPRAPYAAHWKQIRQGKLGELHRFLTAKEKKSVASDEPTDAQLAESRRKDAEREASNSAPVATMFPEDKSQRPMRR